MSGHVVVGMRVVNESWGWERATRAGGFRFQLVGV